MWGLASKLPNTLTCEPQITHSESGRSGGDPWQSRRVAATLGPRQHGLLGANSSPKSSSSISSKKSSFTSLCQTDVAKEPEDLRAH